MRIPRHARPLLQLSMIILLIALGGCAQIGQMSREMVAEPDLRVVDVEFENLSLTQLAATVVLEVDNPNDFSLDVGRSTYALAFGGDTVLEGRAEVGSEVPAAAKGLVRLPLSLDLANAFGSLRTLATTRTLPYEVNGKVPLGPLRLPYSKSGSWALPKIPSVSVERIEVGELGFTDASIGVRLKISNPNDFPIDLQGIAFRLNLSERDLGHGSLSGLSAIQANGDTSLDANLSISLIDAGMAMMTILRGEEARYQLSGELTLPSKEEEKEKRSVPFSLGGSVPIWRK